MIRLDDVHFHTKIEDVKPDANKVIRFSTQYLTDINEKEIQTTDGVIALL